MLRTKSVKLLKSVGKTLLRIVSWPFRWIVSLFFNEWEITIWYAPVKKTTYNFKWVEKCEAKHIKGRLTSGEPFEMKTQEPFNFQIKKVK
jgi:hypothetical protein